MIQWPTVLLFIVSVISTSAQQTISGSFNFGGRLREFAIYEPANFDNANPVPLILVLHHNGATGPGVMDYMGFKPVADTANFLSVYPTALEDQFASPHAWNSGLNVLNQIDDVGFLSVLIDTMMTRYRIDTNRIYATGHSMGGFMCYRLACQLSNRIAAIAPSAGTLAYPISLNCNPPRPVAVMHKHGTNDGTVKWDGSAPPFSTSVDSTISFWVRHNHCPGTPVVTQLPDLVNDGQIFETYLYGPCDNNSEVLLYKGNGAPHGWQATGHDISPPVEAWHFFSRYTLDMFVTTGIKETTEKGFKIFPNPFSESLTLSISVPQIKSVVVTDIAGRQIISEPVDLYNNATLNTSILPEGIYILKFPDMPTLGGKKLIKVN